MPGELKILWHGESDDIAVSIDLATFRELSGWLLAAEQAGHFSLHEALTLVAPLLAQVAEALIRDGNIDEAERAVWAALRLRLEIERQGGDETNVNC